jgi:nucleoid DNA-binding protein
MRVQREYRTVSRDNYERFMDSNPDIDIDYKKWVEVIGTCNRMFMQKALDTGEDVRLPHGFGVFRVLKYKQKAHKILNGEKRITLPVDWQASKREGYIVYNMNFHTSGYRFKWIWTSKLSRITIPNVWVFKPCRWASRELARYINKDNYYSELYKEI